MIPITFLIIYQVKRVILWWKVYDKSFISYHYTYDISKGVLDLDPDLCQNFLIFVTLWNLHAETSVIPQWKAVSKDFISSIYT